MPSEDIKEALFIEVPDGRDLWNRSVSELGFKVLYEGFDVSSMRFSAQRRMSFGRVSIDSDVGARSMSKVACSDTTNELGLSELVGIPGINSVVVEKFNCTT